MSAKMRIWQSTGGVRTLGAEKLTSSVSQAELEKIADTKMVSQIFLGWFNIEDRRILWLGQILWLKKSSI
jgi:hypothetical protein